MSKKRFEFGEHPGTLIKYVSSKYLLSLPEGYNADPKRRWPLAIFLHGAGERGTKARKLALNGLPKVVREGGRLPCILLAPLCPAGECWDDDSVLDVITYVQSQYRVDEKRLYLTGLSMGGFGTWSLLVNHPETWAAAAPICGGGSTIGILLAPPPKLKALRRLPVRAFHGAKDDIVAPQESERMVAALKHVGCKDVQLTIYPEADHDSWTQTYASQPFLDWLLAQKKKKGKQREEKGRPQTRKMMRPKVLFGALFGSLLLAACLVHASDEPKLFRNVRFEDALKEAAAAKKIVLIDFFTTWCAPCKLLDKTTWKDARVIALLREKTIPLMIDAEKETALAERFNIEEYPTLLLLKPDGSVLGRLVGYMEADKFISEFEAAFRKQSTGTDNSPPTSK